MKMWCVVFKGLTFEWTSFLRAHTRGEAIDLWKDQNEKLNRKLQNNTQQEFSWSINEVIDK